MTNLAKVVGAADPERVCISQPHCRCGATEPYSCNCLRPRRRRADGSLRCRCCGITLVTVKQYEARFNDAPVLPRGAEQ